MSLFEELKRRNIFKVAAAYAVIGWILVQITTVAQPAFAMPDWVTTVVFYFTIIGFPIALVLAWAFEMTPEGIRATTEKPDAGDQKHHSGALFIFVTLGIGFSYWLGTLDISDEFEPEAGTGKITQTAKDEPALVPGFSGRAAIAVMPFVNLSDDAAQEYFADGITEDIITSLQSIRTFPIIARTSTFSYKGTSPDLRQVARELGVGYILEGSVRKVDNRVRITAQLINAQGQHVWAENYDRELKNIFELQDEITRHIVTAIEPEILAVEIDRVNLVQKPDLEAWDYYLQALADSIIIFGYTDINGERVTLERNLRARELALMAIEIDPNFAKAYTLLSHIEGMFIFNLRPDVSDEFAEAALERAIVYGERARSISPFDATGCSCHAILLLWAGRANEAMTIQKQNVEVNPASANARAIYAMILSHFEDYDLALEEINLGVRLSPRDMGMSYYLSIKAEILQAMGNFNEAVSVADQALFHTQLNFDAHIIKVISLFALDRRKDASDALASLMAIFPNFTTALLFDQPVATPLKMALGLGDAGLSYPELVTQIFTELGWSGASE